MQQTGGGEEELDEAVRGGRVWACLQSSEPRRLWGGKKKTQDLENKDDMEELLYDGICKSCKLQTRVLSNI